VITIRRLEPALRDAFFALHCDANGAGWCRCIAWWVPTWDGWDGRTAEGNRSLREELFDRGEYDGYLLFVTEDGVERPVAWCQTGPRDRLIKLARQFALAPEPDTWAISCFFVAPSHRRQGLVAQLLDHVLRDLARRGAKQVEAFPKLADDLDAEDLWTGPRALLSSRGFAPRPDRAKGDVWVRSLGDLVESGSS